MSLKHEQKIRLHTLFGKRFRYKNKKYLRISFINLVGKKNMLLLLTLINVCFCLRMQSHTSSIQTSLLLITIELEAINKTLSDNAYVPYLNPASDNAQTASGQRYNKYQCTMFDEQSISLVEKYIAEVEEQTKRVEKQLQEENTQKYNEEVAKKKSEIQYYKFVMNHPCGFNSDHSPVVSLPKPDINLLNSIAQISSSNWLTNQNTQNYINTLTPNNLPTNKCPLSTPYIVDGRCTACQQATPVYDVSLSKCTNCPINTYFSEITHSCKGNDPQHPTCDGGRYENADGVCMCRQSKPFWTGKSCVECYAPLYFDFFKRLCVGCPPLHYFSSDAHECVPTNCTLTEIFDPLTHGCSCPWYRPLSINRTCVQCPNNTIYNPITQKCLQCPFNGHVSQDGHTCVCDVPSQIYSIITHKCECPGQKPILVDGVCVECEGEYNAGTGECEMCGIGSGMEYVDGQCVCGQQYPLFTGDICVFCEAHHYYDVDVGACKECPKGTTINNNENFCVCIAPKQLIDGKCQCPYETPFFSHGECIACSLPKYFNKTSQQCSACANGSKFSVSSQSCEVVPCHPGFIYDSIKGQCLCMNTSLHYVVDGVCTLCSPSQYEVNGTCVECGGGRMWRNGSCECVQKYWNGQECVSCNEPNYWDKDELSCKECGRNMEYKDGQCRCSGSDVFEWNDTCVSCEQAETMKIVIGGCIRCEGGRIVDLPTNECICPLHKPFYNGIQCISCYFPQYFNTQELECTSCPLHKVYNISAEACQYCPSSHPLLLNNKCVECPPNTHYDEQSYQCLGCSDTQYYDEEAGECKCLEGSFWTGTKCIQCYLPSYFDLVALECKQCPPNTIYQMEQHQCLPCPSDRPKLLDGKCTQCLAPKKWVEGLGDCQ